MEDDRTIKDHMIVSVSRIANILESIRFSFADVTSWHIPLAEYGEEMSLESQVVSLVSKI